VTEILDEYRELTKSEPPAERKTNKEHLFSDGRGLLISALAIDMFLKERGKLVSRKFVEFLLEDFEQDLREFFAGKHEQDSADDEPKEVITGRNILNRIQEIREYLDVGGGDPHSVFLGLNLGLRVAHSHQEYDIIRSAKRIQQKASTKARRKARALVEAEIIRLATEHGPERHGCISTVTAILQRSNKKDAKGKPLYKKYSAKQVGRIIREHFPR
jgi:hypothetical protein